MRIRQLIEINAGERIDSTATTTITKKSEVRKNEMCHMLIIIKKTKAFMAKQGNNKEQMTGECRLLYER